MLTVTPKFHAPSGQTRLMIEHVDRRGLVSLLPLSHETQHFFAARIGEKKAGGSRGGVREKTSPADLGRQGTGPTMRELQVLDLLIAGLSSKLIAYELSISHRTVEVHRANLMKKMGVRNAAALIRVALAAA
jgi:DNA-binding NarL/FixJ family response regulator